MQGVHCLHPPAPCSHSFELEQWMSCRCIQVPPNSKPGACPLLTHRVSSLHRRFELDRVSYPLSRSTSGPTSRSGVHSLGLIGPSLGGGIHLESYHYATTGTAGSGHSLFTPDARSSRPAALKSSTYPGMAWSTPDLPAIDLLDDYSAPTNFLDTCGEIFGTIPFQQSLGPRGACDPPFGGRRLAGCTCGLPLHSITSSESSTSNLLAEFPQRPPHPLVPGETQVHSCASKTPSPAIPDSPSVFIMIIVSDFRCCV